MTFLKEPLLTYLAQPIGSIFPSTVENQITKQNMHDYNFVTVMQANASKEKYKLM